MKRTQTELWASANALLLTALLLLTVPLPWVGAALLAGSFHEFCHGAVILLLGGKIYRLRAGCRGAAMEIGCLSPIREMLAAAAGPAGSLLLLLVRKQLPRTALCGLIQGLYNLLPVYPMDGGRILWCFLALFLPERTALKIRRAVKWLTAGLLTAGSIWAFRKMEQKTALFLPLFLLIFPMIRGKIPCKQGLPNVQ